MTVGFLSENDPIKGIPPLIPSVLKASAKRVEEAARCQVIAAVPTMTSGIIFEDPNVKLVHPITQTHTCNGSHRNRVPGIIFHECDCGATFYRLDEALNALVGHYAISQE